MAFYDRLLSLSTTLSGFIHVEACITTSFLLLPDNIPLYGYTTYYLTIHQSMVIPTLGHEQCCYEYLCKSLVWTYVFASLESIPRSEIAESHGNAMSEVLRNCQAVF